MTANTSSIARRDASLANILSVVVIGVGLIFTAAFVPSQVMHDAAHDMRHSIGFPCH